MNSTRPPFTEEEVKELRTMLEAKTSLEVIAIHFGLSRSGLSGRLDTLAFHGKIPWRKQKPKYISSKRPARKEKMYNEYEQIVITRDEKGKEIGRKIIKVKKRTGVEDWM